MKATLDIPDDLYRRVKAKSALEGRPVREVTVQLFRRWVGEKPPGSGTERGTQGGGKARPPWFGALRRYARNAKGRHDMQTVRKSIVRGRSARRAGEERPA